MDKDLIVGFGLNGGLLIVVWWWITKWVRRIDGKVEEVLEEAIKTNGNIIQIKQEIKDHDRLDDARFVEVHRRMDRMEHK